MSVAGRVAPIVAAMGGRWNGIATSCHFATFYWLFLEEFRRPPTVNDYVSAGNPTLVLNRMLALGRRLQRPAAGPLILAAGNVIVFSRDGQAGHSCVAISPQRIGGYNQTNWFATAGANHGFTFHGARDLRWADGACVIGNTGQHCDLHAIPEGPARAIVRQAVQ